MILATDTFPFPDLHGRVYFDLRVIVDPRLPTPRQKRSESGLMRDYRASLKNFKGA